MFLCTNLTSLWSCKLQVLTYVYYFNFHGFIHADILKWGIFTFTGKVQYELDLCCQLGVILFCLWYVLLLLLGSSTSHTPSHCSITLMNSLCPCLVCGFTCLSFMICCCCSVLSLTYVLAAFELSAYQTTAMWDCEWLAYHDITFFAVHWLRVFHAHIDWIRSTFNQITPISFAPVPWPLPPRAPRQLQIPGAAHDD